MGKRSWSKGAVVVLLVSLSLAGAKVENSFQSQYSQYKDPGAGSAYTYPDLTVKNGDSSVVLESQDTLVGQASGQQPVVNPAPNQQMYYYETYPMTDSSRQNGYGVQNGNKRCTMMGNGNMRCYSRQDATTFNDYDTSGSDDTGSGAGLGGLAGLIGLLGLKGIKGLASVVFPAIFPLLFPLLLPLLLPILLPLLLVLALPLLLLPIPVISVPAPTGRALATGLNEARRIATSVFEKVVASDQCVERISCEISKMSKKRKAGEWVEKVLNYLPESSPVTKRIVKGFQEVNGASNSVEGKSDHQVCKKMTCRMFSAFEQTSG